jgi:hypothetical protein
LHPAKPVGNTWTCQSPAPLPTSFHPHCLPRGCMIATREIQFRSEFMPNLMRRRGHPIKTQTCRVWSGKRQLEHYRNYKSHRWVRVWCGQGNVATIGWMQIVSWQRVLLRTLTKDDCNREGRPNMSVNTFLNTYFKGHSLSCHVLRLRFVFVPCECPTKKHR